MDHPSTSPRARSRGFSFRSDKSAGSKGKVDLTETPEDKARRDSIYKSNSKANPNAALNEAQPGVLNLTEQSTLVSLRTTPHKDVNGNVIVDPDLSNPTRPRMERPLDTIRSFEKAIDNGYKRRSSYLASQPPQDGQNQFGSKRSSNYYGKSPQLKQKPQTVANVHILGYEQGRHSAMGGNGYYGGRPESQVGGSQFNGQQRQRYGSRVMSEGAIPREQRPYNQHTYHQSQNTMNTDGSDSTGPWANSTDPSSENSSIDRNMYGNNNGYGHGQGQNGYNNRAPITEEGSAGPAYGGPVQPPTQRRPIPLGNATGTPIIPLPSGKLPSTARGGETDEKKKGWLKRRFSKKA
ncbi:hypothetical protein LTR62_004282 [Meristemomyces frigidus]|uniref:Uncharacterized protein n=1 Tax=Meristemomyces frigidus TaxID=1508187 RepID=A0AAN7YGF3_9PEZI|nr:hypothetical protein LTR62_004282 [Meristemomyces frigidus]